MSAASQKWSALFGSLGVFMIASALYWRLAPVDGSEDLGLWVSLAPWLLAIAGGGLAYAFKFLTLLRIIKIGRSGMASEQKTRLSKLTGPMIGMLGLLVVGAALGFAAPLFDGGFGIGGSRLAWPVYLTGYALWMATLPMAVLARLYEIKVLSVV
ncbi:hypothetical protein MMB232_02096 [Brevundimonas subvibrioides]|uniref:hypothetical protein n=1 Tax=Brevundimonas subvibrioides TaxID=74313 RepID=UPI0032D5A514